MATSELILQAAPFGNSVHLAFITAVPITIAFLHFLLYLFDLRSVRNLYVSVIAACFGGVALADAGLLPEKAQWVLIPAMVLGIAAYVYAVFLSHQPPQLTAFAIISVAVAIMGMIETRWGYLPGRLLVLAVVFDTFRVALKHWDRRPRGSLAPAFGMMIFGFTGALDMLMDLDLLPPILGISNPYLYGGSIMVLTMSVDLASSYATTNKELEQQIVQVRELMNQTIAHEREAREEEVRRRVIEADNERKTRELVEAREMQLSMIPPSLPICPGLEIAGSMEVATEVGGDFYDFRIDRTGALTLAIGDAVGHGMRAGVVVAVTKALFATVREDETVSEVLLRFDEAIRSMRLGRARMCLLLAKFDGRRVEIANAGMPPPIFRSSEGLVEELHVVGLPLGVRRPGSRQSLVLNLAEADMIVFVSDGFPEARKAPYGEMFGYEAVQALIRRSDSPSPESLATEINSAVVRHLGESAPDDDRTLVAIMKRGVATARED